LAALETDLERVRADYAARSATVEEHLEEIRKRIGDLRETGPSDLHAGYALLDASLQTMQGRLWSRRNREASMQAFQRAVELFEQHRAEVEQHKNSMRILTDWGIALHRIGRTEDSIALLSRVCQGGAAPGEAFGYLGYGELARGNLAAAEAALRKGLEITPINLTMNSYMARVLDLSAKQIAATEGPEKAAAARKEAIDAYCRAGEIERSAGDSSWAGRDGLRALRLDPTNERALELCVISYLSLRRLKLTLLILERFLTRKPGHPRALAIKGTLLREIGDVEGSVAVLRAIPVDSPDLAWVRAQLAISLSSGSAPDRDSALREAREAVALAPQEPFVHRVLGLLAVDYNVKEAAVSLTRARDLGDNSEEVALNLGRALASSGAYLEAENVLDQVLAANPRSAYAQYLLGWCEEHLGNSDRALAHYRKASRLAPEEPTVFISLMELLGGKERRDQAMDEIESRLSGPLRYMALWYKGRLEIRDGDWRSALETLPEAERVATEVQAVEALPAIFMDYGDALRQAGKYENAKAAYARARVEAPSWDDVLFRNAICHCEIAEFEEARTCLEKAFDADRQTLPKASLWYLQGWCLQHLGDFRWAVNCYQKAFELSDRKDPWSRKSLANALMNFDRAQAREHFAAILDEQKYKITSEGATERQLGNKFTLGLLGWCNYRLGLYDEAIRLFEAVLNRYGDEQPIQFDLALAYLASGRFRLATEAYRRGYEMTAACEHARQRGVYYIALFDLADARRQERERMGPDSDIIFQSLVRRLNSVGLVTEGLHWLVS
jgi:tetratricopeptide (TPR) repeat protein